MKVAIADDEKKETDLLSGYIRKYCEKKYIDIQVVVFHDAQSFLDKYTPDYDIVLMDIEMPGLINGMEAARELRTIDESVVIMFITNMAQYAINGYEVQAVDFVLKPINYMEFALKMEKAIRYVDKERDTKLALQTVEGTVYIKVAEIYFVEVIGHYLTYHTTIGEFKARGTMKEVESKLEEYKFYRVSNGFMVNLKYVDNISGNTVTVGNTQISISRGKKTDFMQELVRYMGGV